MYDCEVGGAMVLGGSCRPMGAASALGCMERCGGMKVWKGSPWCIGCSGSCLKRMAGRSIGRGCSLGWSGSILICRSRPSRISRTSRTSCCWDSKGIGRLASEIHPAERGMASLAEGMAEEGTGAVFCETRTG